MKSNTDLRPRATAPTSHIRYFIGILIFIILMFTFGDRLLSTSSDDSVQVQGHTSASEGKKFAFLGPESTERSKLGDHSTIVRCWPSSGGFVVKPWTTGVELDYLGLSRFENTPRKYNDSAEEDAFCEKLERIGGAHYKDERSFHQSQAALARRFDAWIGWPKGGKDTEGFWLVVLDGFAAAKQGAVRIDNARDMDERCNMIEKTGGRYYGPQDWSKIKSLLQEALSWEGDGMPGKGDVVFGDLLS
ncbi:hypothetical protein C1H76_2923 [Elsinoe australis]|uniref:Uncharacterized protein n=1 Tax=Elsinoe australis TaxID=40998 RepID=A0A4U7B0T0_9PEZI|nr:hypothetical protein C1H76_2923 [Elsinoe australis]